MLDRHKAQAGRLGGLREERELGEKKDAERLNLERQLIPQRLAAFLIGNSVLVLGFATIMEHSVCLSKVLSVIGVLVSLWGSWHFAPLPKRLDDLEGEEAGLRSYRFSRWRKGRFVGIPFSAFFIGFWICAVIWSFK